ncbi:Spermidine synthase-like protein [Dinothrombium tinctorium]|uniref:Spermidine synthase-like protein n=1 Tax=Dinothrombium tinctorium TaxID=1965070 RepID=A0A443QSK6_9ACAR|nr:Spermidine synthase-like protein [Dinothrombium tinctorium]
MDSFKNGWFTEQGVLNSDSVAVSIKYDRVLHREKSQFQDILVFESSMFGRCLVLNDAIQCTEIDEFSYQESIAFLPLNCHPHPKKVLIIGGGDGGVAREVLKHPLVEDITQCEIDEAVINVSKNYFPSLSCSYADPRLKLVIADGYEFVKNHKEVYDVIITDSSDPNGPAQCLFERPYFQSLWEALNPGGIICSQAESYWFDLKLIKSMYKTTKSIFKSVTYATIAMPTYPSGQIGFIIACKDQTVDFSQPLYKFSSKQQESMNLKYYSEKMHTSSFILPTFVEEALSKE